MRFSAAVLLMAAIPASAEASSLIMLEPMEARLGPSMVELAAAPALPEAAEPMAHSRSMVAFGDAVPAVSHEKLAAIGPAATTAENRLDAVPMVIRGGITGDAFSRSEPAPAAEPQRAAAEQSDSGMDGVSQPTSESRLR